ncbi:hypothetical protein RTP6_007334 [Batrachochytrium dendrobatidis]
MYFQTIFLASVAAMLVMGAPIKPSDSQTEQKYQLPGYYAPQIKYNYTLNDQWRNTTLNTTDIQHNALTMLEGMLTLGENVTMQQRASPQDQGTGLYRCNVIEKVNGIDIANTHGVIHTDKFGNPIGQTSSWVNVTQELKATVDECTHASKLSPIDAVIALTTSLGQNFTSSDISQSIDQDNTIIISGLDALTLQTVTVKNKLYKTKDSIKCVWEVNLEIGISWVVAYIDKTNGQIIGSQDWSSSATSNSDGTRTVRLLRRALVTESDPNQKHLEKRQARQDRRQQQKITPTGNIPSSSYFVIPLGGIDPDTVPQMLISNPIDKDSSPLGWHDDGLGQGPVSQSKGNNAVVKDNRALNDDPNVGILTAPDFKFEFTADFATQDPSQYISSSITNIFFLVNFYHDIMFKYGFDEVSGNFQTSNIGDNGKSNDAVVAMVQDGSGKNNANFATPPDGASGIMRMFTWTSKTPNLDGSMDNSVIIHELTHGLSTRLTGGPDDSSCLQLQESSGMGEGWSDFLSLALEAVVSDTPETELPIGGYSTGNRKNGVRSAPYTTNVNVNRRTYADAGRTNSVHSIGESWAIALWEAYWLMVQKLGFEPNLMNSESGKGNTVFLKLVVQGMKLQPCNPTMVIARNAIILADQQLFGGANFCEIQKGFAKRGLGANAQSGVFVNDFTVDPKCQ